MPRQHDVPDMRWHLQSLGGYEEEEKHVVGEVHGEQLATFTLRLTDVELPLFDLWANEHIRICGVEIRYYSFDADNTDVDPVYNEPINRAWNGPFKMFAFVGHEPGSATAEETGFRIEWYTEAWIPRREFERVGCPAPSEGDILEFWRIPYFDGASGGEGYFFDVTQVADDGHLFDGPAFVGFLFDIRRNTTFTPEQKIIDSPEGPCP